MRVIAGRAKGMRLVSPKSAAVRPATDRVKESLFGILVDFVAEAQVLDLFAGSGSVGIEALSRGAAHCTFVETDANCLHAIRENLRKTGLSERARAIRGNALRAPTSIEPPQEGFDLVFVDPPYALSERMDAASPVGRLLIGMGEGAFLRSGALVVIEHRSASESPERLGALMLRERRHYGGTTLSFYARASER